MRIIGIGLMLVVIGYVFYSVNTSDAVVKQAIEQNETVRDQKAALQQSGVDVSTPEKTGVYTYDKTKEILDYQKSGNSLPTEEAETPEAPVE